MTMRSRTRSWSEYNTWKDSDGQMKPVGYSKTWWTNGAPGGLSIIRKNPLTCNSGTDTCSDQTNVRLKNGRWSGGGRLGINHTVTEYDPVQLYVPLYPVNVAGTLVGMCDVEVRALLGKWHLAYHDANRAITSADTTADYGARAWSKYKPGKPDAGLGVFIAELRDMPRLLRDTNVFLKSIWNKKYAPTPRQLGKDYLTYQFGMAPFVRDVKKFVNLYQNFDKRLADLRRLNGQWIRRSGSVVTEQNVLGRYEGQNVYGFDWMPNTSAIVQGSYGAWGKTWFSKNVWFVGRFRYWIPETDFSSAPLARANMARKMAGLSITAANVWEVIPWSWLIDYFVRVGDLLENLDNGLASEVVAKYAYLMNTSEVRSEQWSHASFKGGSTINGIARKVTVTKTRVAASPFGFGLTSNLSDSQLAILSALGLSRMR